VTLESIRRLEEEAFQEEAPDLLTATAVSALNQALYDLLARRNGVPVWRLFTEKPAQSKVPIYVTINRALRSRDEAEYRRIVSLVEHRGFRHYKCAPFERVTPGSDQVKAARFGLAILRTLRRDHPDLAVRVDFHKRFAFEPFMKILPDVNRLNLFWIEEPCEIGAGYRQLHARSTAKLAAGELYYGLLPFREIVDNAWADVIMPDVKHVGGFGPLLKVCRYAAERGVEVSPHNPSGPVSTLASLHAAVLFDNVGSLEWPFDPETNKRPDERFIAGGCIHLPDKPGWGIEAYDLAGPDGVMPWLWGK
jgi:galactonate dehydratase